MIWRSVVGKLWGTILILVSVVLFILTILLMQLFEDLLVEQAEGELTNVANSIASVIESNVSTSESMSTVSALIEAHDANAIIVSKDDEYSLFTTNKQLDPSFFKEEPKFSKVFEEGATVTLKRNFNFDDTGVPSNYLSQSDESIIIGVPVLLDGERGAVFLYQSLGVIEDTHTRAKHIIFLSAGIAIILTTVFAFFLSSRITAPLRTMKEASMQIAQGKFDTQVPNLTNDEIGELALTFNNMGKQLKNNITALNQEKEQLSSILSSMADGVITFDRRGSILVTNPPAERFLQAWNYEHGYSNVESNELPSEIIELFEQVVTFEMEQMAELDFQRRSWVVVMTPLYNQSTIRGAVAVFRDMTEERRLDKLREDFIANVSHELRTPISMLQGYSEAIIDNIANTEDEKREIAKIIYDESLRMGRLVNELLDMARVEAGYIELDYGEYVLDEFLQRIVRKFQGLSKEQGIDLILDVSENITLTADIDRLEQVLTNLVDNAIRHTSKGGTVSLIAKEINNGIEFNIKDTGSGIPQEDLPFVFERFYKADKARTRGRSGTGIGLAIARNIVEAHGGQISVSSERNIGTTFSFFIPRKLEDKH